MKSMFNKALVLALIVAGSVQAAQADKALAAFSLVAEQAANQQAEQVANATDLAQDLLAIDKQVAEAAEFKAALAGRRAPVISEATIQVAKPGMWARFKGLFSNPEADREFQIRHDRLMEGYFEAGYPDTLSYTERLAHGEVEGYKAGFFSKVAARIKDMPANFKNAAMFVKENPLTVAGYAAAAYLAYEYALKPAYNKLFAKKAAQQAPAKKAAVRS